MSPRVALAHPTFLLFEPDSLLASHFSATFARQAQAINFTTTSASLLHITLDEMAQAAAGKWYHLPAEIICLILDLIYEEDRYH
jgi:hypothetical protein